MVIEQLMQWFNIPYLIWTRDVEIVSNELRDGDQTARIRIYTASNIYAINARVGTVSYLGCIATARMPRAGEDWSRGNDLPDGNFSQETFDNIMKAIVGYEVVKVHQKADGKSVAQDSTPNSALISEIRVDTE